MTRSTALRISICLLAVAAGPSAVRAELRDDFESSEPAFRDAGGDVRFRVDRRERTAEGAHSGIGCELWQLAVLTPGTTLWLSYDVGRAPVIDESNVGLWVRGDRSGTQLAARVVFPRALEPRSGQPLSALVYGSSYSKPGTWERLAIANVREQVEQQARILSAQLKIPVDPTEAYLDRALVNAFVGTGPTRVWLDDLELSGVVYGPKDPRHAFASKSNETTTTTTIDALPATVEMKGQSLLVNGRHFFPRMIEYRGEPLPMLQGLGFNSVRLRETPSRELLDEAKRLGMWIVCPPPKPPDLQTPYGATTGNSSEAFGDWFFPVLAWDLGDGWSAADFELLKRWAEHVRRHDLPRSRPILCGAVADVRLLSRHVDIVRADRLPLGTDFELTQYGRWLRERSRLTRAGTPIWATVQTQPIEELSEQARRLVSPDAPAVPIVEGEQIRLMTYEALATGVRGICFDSQTPLTAEDPATRARAANLNLLNLELELIDVWSSSGNYVTEVEGSAKDVAGALLQIDRGHLLLPMWTGSGAQYVPGQSAGVGVSFVVPGVPESVDVFELAPGGMRPLVRRRVTGGVKITLDEFCLTSIILLTQDPQVVAVCGQRLAVVQQQMLQLEREATAAKLQLAEIIHRTLTTVAPPVPQAAAWLTSAGRSLRAAEARGLEGNLREAHFETRRALRPLALLERAHWDAAVKAIGSTNENPFLSSFASLPEAWRMHERLRTAPPQWENLLAAGDFEELQQVVASGWRHFRHEQEGVRSDADLAGTTRPADAAAGPSGQTIVARSGTAAAAGRSGWFSLRLAAAPISPQTAPLLVESPPLWVTSPPVVVRAGQLLRFSGWVYVPAAVSGTLDGLTVFDTIGGDKLAQRFAGPAGWKKFSYYRIAPTDGNVQITAAMNGFGEAFLDDVKIEAVRQ